MDSSAEVDARDSWQLLRSLRRERFDLAIVLPNSLRTGLWAWASGAKRTLGYARNGRSLLLTDAVPAPSRAVPHPVLDEMLQLVGQLGCGMLSRKLELATLPQDEEQLAAFWRRHPVVNSTSYVCLNTGGAFGAAKDWPTEYFVELSRRLAEELDRTVLIVCGPQERSTAQRIVSEAASTSPQPRGRTVEHWPDQSGSAECEPVGDDRFGASALCDGV